MIRTEFNGNFGLDEIKKIRIRNMGLNTVYDVRFVNDKRIIIATRLHCFLTDDGEPKVLSDLKAGDKIWINTNELSNFKVQN
jgi:intein/homing endonuclease